jgi:hypothetical protein
MRTARCVNWCCARAEKVTATNTETGLALTDAGSRTGINSELCFLTKTRNLEPIGKSRLPHWNDSYSQEVTCRSMRCRFEHSGTSFIVGNDPIKLLEFVCFVGWHTELLDLKRSAVA